MTTEPQGEEGLKAELLGCPFCGAEALFHRIPAGYAVSCSECGARPIPNTANRITEAEAIAAWQTRQAAVQGREIEALQIIAAGDYDNLAGDPMRWADVIARAALGLPAHPNGDPVHWEYADTLGDAGQGEGG